MKKYISQIFLKLVLIIVFAIGVYYLRLHNVDLRTEIALGRKQIELSPNEATAVSVIERELKDSQERLEPIFQVAPDRDSLVGVVADIANLGVTYDVKVAVPKIREFEQLDEKGNIIEQKGVLLPVRLDISASGDPEKLVEFFHAVETLPYALYFESWNITALADAVSQQFASTTPTGGEVPEIPPSSFSGVVVLQISSASVSSNSVSSK